MGIERDYLMRQLMMLFVSDKVERESTSFSMDRQMKLSKLREYLN